MSLNEIRLCPFLRNTLTCYTKHTLKQQLLTVGEMLTVTLPEQCTHFNFRVLSLANSGNISGRSRNIVLFQPLKIGQILFVSLQLLRYSLVLMQYINNLSIICMGNMKAKYQNAIQIVLTLFVLSFPFRAHFR